MNMRRLIYLALIVGFVGLAYLYSQAQREALESKNRESFNRLVHYVAQHGETETVGSGLFKVHVYSL